MNGQRKKLLTKDIEALHQREVLQNRYNDLAKDGGKAIAEFYAEETRQQDDEARSGTAYTAGS
jgi:hypothetical protein